jgi:hypothetical protein
VAYELVALLIVGALVSLFILLLHFWSWNDYQQDFSDKGAFLLWAGLVCTRTGGMDRRARAASSVAPPPLVSPILLLC